MITLSGPHSVCRWSRLLGWIPRKGLYRVGAGRFSQLLVSPGTAFCPSPKAAVGGPAGTLPPLQGTHVATQSGSEPTCFSTEEGYLLGQAQYLFLTPWKTFPESG